MKFYNNLRRWLILAFAFLYLSNYFINSSHIKVLYSIVLLLVILQAIPDLPKTNLKVSLSLFIIGGVFLYVNNISLNGWLSAIAKNAGLITLFITVPLLGLPFFYENYQEELKKIASKHMTNVCLFCLLTAVVTHILGVIISIGCIPIVYELFNRNARLYKAEKLFLAALVQGYMTTGFWSPAWASTAIVTHELQISWLRIIPFGILLTTISISLTLLFIYIKVKRNPQLYQNLSPQPSLQINWRYVFTLITLITSLILIIMLFNYFTGWSILAIIPVVACIYPLVTAVVQKKLPQYKKGLGFYYDEKLFKTKNEVVLFTAAGFLGKSLELSNVSQAIPQLLPSFLTNYPVLMIFFLMAIMLLISLTGIHPVVTGSALVGSLTPLSLGLSPLTFALTILAGWAISILVSPFSAVNLVMSGLTSMPSWDISLKINGRFGVFMLFIISGIIALLSNIF